MKYVSLLSLTVFLTACSIHHQNNPISINDDAVGILNNNPKATLDVSGDIRLSSNNDLCLPIIAGTIRWNGVEFEGCDGISWKSFKMIRD